MRITTMKIPRRQNLFAAALVGAVTVIDSVSAVAGSKEL